MKKLIAGIVIGVVATAATAAVASTVNDVVLNESRYTEYFKKEGNGGKNYLYTETREVDAPKSGECVVVTGASETAIAIWCNTDAR